MKVAVSFVTLAFIFSKLFLYFYHLYYSSISPNPFSYGAAPCPNWPAQCPFPSRRVFFFCLENKKKKI